jgi:predicted Fe-Mo cluster-binding NifX family protein
MKIAITSTGNTLDANMDKRFGRCSWFVVYDTEYQSMEFIPNQNKDNIEGAGEAAVDLIASRNVKKVISGEFGIKVKASFDKLQIQLIILPDQTKSIRTILKYLTPKQ